MNGHIIEFGREIRKSF